MINSDQAEPTTPKFTGEFSYIALEYWANKGRSDRGTLGENSIKKTGPVPEHINLGFI